MYFTAACEDQALAQVAIQDLEQDHTQEQYEDALENTLMRNVPRVNQSRPLQQAMHTRPDYIHLRIPVSGVYASDLCEVNFQQA